MITNPLKDVINNLKENKMAKVSFFDTAVGKTVKVAAWTALSVVLAVLIQNLGSLTPENLVWLIPTINTGLVAAKSLVDKNIPNFPQ